MKICSKCRVEKELCCFHKGANYINGVRSICKDCVKEYHKVRYKKKPPEYFEEKRREKEKAKAAEKLLLAEERLRKLELERPIRDAERKRKKAEYNKKYRASHPGSRRIEKKNRKLRIRASGRLSTGISKKLLLLQKGKCAICRDDILSGYHIDHVVPIALNGTNTDDNVQLLCPKCNISKGAKHPIDFMQSLGKLL